MHRMTNGTENNSQKLAKALDDSPSEMISIMPSIMKNRLPGCNARDG